MAKNTKYDWVLRKYPELISKEQMAQICQISKKTCLYLLTSGLVPCQDRGTVTHRFLIRAQDVVEYLKQREICPEKYRPPKGYYYNRRPVKETPQAKVISVLITKANLHAAQDYFAGLLRNYPDVMNTLQVAEFLGYSRPTVTRWCHDQRMRFFSIHKSIQVPQEYLIEFILGDYFMGLKNPSGKQAAYTQGLAQHLLEDAQKRSQKTKKQADSPTKKAETKKKSAKKSNGRRRT